MKADIEHMRLGAQDTLDELFTEHLIPFELSARKVDCIGIDEYIVRFYDSRLRSIDISWSLGQSFRSVFRASVLDRVKRLSGPLHQFSAHRARAWRPMGAAFLAAFSWSFLPGVAEPTCSKNSISCAVSKCKKETLTRLLIEAE
jgi:hypothetical protein